jgi:CRP-like cAMP-binding protein
MPTEYDFRIFIDRAQETVSLRPGEFLFREGDTADALYIVSRGTMRIMSGAAIYEVVEGGGIDLRERAIKRARRPLSKFMVYDRRAFHLQLHQHAAVGRSRGRLRDALLR